jgi:nucleotide-binding universal stress UspA family protein
MTVTELLFPTDFSEVSTEAGRVAGELARGFGARLHIVHVVPPVTDPADRAERLGRLASSLGAGLQVETALLTGGVARQIVDYARQKRVGLIVLGTHGRTGVSRAILGSVAEAVVRLAPCPVLTVGPGALEAAAAPVPEELGAAHKCVVCARETEDLVCEGCRARIRGEALARKAEAERRGRQGLPT